MNANEAFREVPPTITLDGQQVTLKPLTEWVWSFLSDSFKDCENSNTLFIAGYIYAASRPGGEVISAKREGKLIDNCEALVLDLSEADSQAVLDYCEAVINRKTATQPEAPETPGKHEAATPPES